MMPANTISTGTKRSLPSGESNDAGPAIKKRREFETVVLKIDYTVRDALPKA